MIGILFQFAGQYVKVVVDGTNVIFTDSTSMIESNIDGLRLDRKGVIKEFPDLADRWDWKEEAVRRFKEVIKQLPNEEERANYLMKDLAKYGYIPKYKQKSGHRVEVIKWPSG